MAALSTETGKCSGITEGGISLRSQEKNIEVASQLTEKLLKGPHKYNAEGIKQFPKSCEDAFKSNKQRFLQNLFRVSTDRPKETYHLPKPPY